MTADPWRPPDWHVEVPFLQPPPPRPRLWRRDDAVAGVVTGLVLVVLGAPVGLIWAAVSPRVDVEGVLNGADNAFNPQFAADYRFLLLAAVAGVVTGLVAVVLGRRRGPGVSIGLFVGGLVAAYVAARVGHLARHQDVVGDIRRLHLAAAALPLLDFKLRSFGALLVWPAVAAAVYAAAALARIVEPEDDVPA